jgi:hypothetical protein
LASRQRLADRKGDLECAALSQEEIIGDVVEHHRMIGATV